MNLTTVAFQGVIGAYSHQAIRKHYQKQVQVLPLPTFEDLFNAVITNQCSAAMVPLENSTTGSIFKNYDLLAKHSVSIINEVFLKISHNLLVIPQPEINTSKRLKMIKKVYSHPQALKQCQKFFNNHPWMKPVPHQDTAGSAADISRNNQLDKAAIASSQAAKIYQLQILKKNIETNKNNFTRFVVIAKNQIVKHPNKVSLIFKIKHQPQALFKIIKPLAENKLNITKIESRPILNKPWEYLFYLDFEINNNQNYRQIIDKIKQNCISLKILGIYQKGKYV